MTNPRDVKYANESIARWQDDLKQRAMLVTNNHAFAMLRAFLHELRARLSLDETARFGNALPAVQRGIFYQDWTPKHAPLPTPSLDEFSSALAARLLPHVHMPDGLAEDVLWVIHNNLEAHDRQRVTLALPEPLRKAWLAMSDQAQGTS